MSGLIRQVYYYHFNGLPGSMTPHPEAWGE